MNELKPEDVMPEGAVVEALELRAPHDAVCRYALALLREKDATLKMCAETIERQDKELAKKDAEIERLTSRVEVLHEIELSYALQYGNAIDKDIARKQLRAEAITEFSKELTSELINGGIYPVFVKGAIERTAKKLKGEADG